MRRSSILRISTSKTIVRLAALGLLLLSSLGPWFTDAHPATAETCTAPLVWLGDGYCACIISLIALYTTVGDSSNWGLSIPPLLPILSTLLLFLGGNHRSLWYVHLMAWFMIAVYSLFFFIINLAFLNKAIFLWGAGLCGTVAVLLLAWEILTINRQPAN